MTRDNVRKRIWGWFFFDWASQPYHTVLLTFIFGPFFASVAANYYLGQGLTEQAADARAQSVWSLCLTISGLVIGFGAPFLGAFADTTGRRMPWIYVFSLLYVLGASMLWFTAPDGSNLWWMLIAFGVGFIGAEYALIFVNSQLPSLGSRDEVGEISGSGFAFGYVGGLVALALSLALLVEQPSGKTLIGLDPVFGFDPDNREGTRAAGPFAAIWFILFMVPYFFWMQDDRKNAARGSFNDAMSSLKASILGLRHRSSLAAYLASSMFYRDALNGLYSFGGTYALLVLNWQITTVGIFGIVSGVAAAAFSYFGGKFDRRFGPKPVIRTAIWVLIGVCGLIIAMKREAIAGIPLAEGSQLPDILFFGCGMLIGGMGGVLQSASRSMMVRHCDPASPTESFGLYGLSGRATAFIAPALIGLVTAMTESARIGVSPLIGLFLLGLVLLIWVKPDGEDEAVWASAKA